MRRAARVDVNQSAIVQALREAGASVQCLHQLGRGTPDLLVGHMGLNYLLELKDGTKTPSKRKLTEDEQAWHSSWLGQVKIVHSAEEALQVIGATPNVQSSDVFVPF